MSGSLSRAASFDATAQYLDTDGSMLGYLDFSGDGQAIAADLDLFYEELRSVDPVKAILPIDFKTLFDDLGFSTIESFGFSSKAVEADLFRNRSVLMMNGSPAGLLRFYFLPDAKPVPFTAAMRAPLDADGVFSGTLNWEAMGDFAAALFTQILGPMGQMLVQGQMQSPFLSETVTLESLLKTLSTRWEGHYRVTTLNTPASKVDFRIRVHGAGHLMTELKASTLPIDFIMQEGQGVANLSTLFKTVDFALYASASAEGDLMLYTDPQWLEAEGKNSLADSPAFKRLMSHLPKAAIWHEYGKGFDVVKLLQPALDESTATTSYLPVMKQAYDRLLGDFHKPYASVVNLKDANITTDQYSHFSYKQIIGLMPLGIGAAIALPAMEKATVDEAGETRND